MSADRPPLRVAIVGGGPRALFAAERLRARHSPTDRDLDVVLFDDRAPGTGAAYDPDQPAFLRLNVGSSLVRAGWPGEPAPFPALDNWRTAHGETAPLDPFPPRALVGAWLGDFWGSLAGDGAGVRVTCRSRRVTDLTPAAGAWLVDGDRFDEVLLATGHERTWPGALSASDIGGVPVTRVFPVRTMLAEAVVAPGSHVLVRGAALTFIDAALALTEGRGGRFEVDGRGGVRYRHGTGEPACIRPVTRSGGFMVPKPEPGSVLARLEGTSFDAARRSVLDAATPVAALDAVPELAVSLGADADEVTALVAGTWRGDPVARLRRGVQVVRGEAAPDAAFLLGRAWQGLYTELRARFEGLADVGTERFVTLGVRMEPLAFGPPPVNAAKLLALVDAGVVDPSALGTAGSGLPADQLAWADVVVDAVLPPPGVVPGSFAASLVDRGHASTRPGRRGLAVTPDASCVDADGVPVPGLAAIGRVTEDVVIGNDTLGRTMHPAVDGWARRVCAR